MSAAEDKAAVTAPSTPACNTGLQDKAVQNVTLAHIESGARHLDGRGFTAWLVSDVAYRSGYECRGRLAGTSKVGTARTMNLSNWGTVNAATP